MPAGECQIDIAAFVLRIALGVTMIAYGWNHAFGAGRPPGTARWFESIGIRPGRLPALLATLTELGASVLLLLGLLNALATAAVVGTMTVARVANHLKNGYFILRPGEGYECVLMITSSVAGSPSSSASVGAPHQAPHPAIHHTQ